MPLLPLVVFPDSRLFLCSEEVRDPGSEEIKTLIDDMFCTMYAEGGIGLAAVQVGVHKRIFVVDITANTRYKRDIVDDKDGYATTCGPTAMINPKIVESSDEMVSMEEGCLSVPGQVEAVVRPERVVVEYVDQNGETKRMKACGLLSRCLQHELDHLNGSLFLQYLSKIKRDMIAQRIKKGQRRLNSES